LSNVVAIAAGAYYNLALKADGTLVAWGAGALEFTETGHTNVVSITSGWCHAFGLTCEDAPAWRAGRLSNPEPGQAGFRASLPMLSGKVYCLEFKNELGQPHWTAWPLLPGTGVIGSLWDREMNAAQRFYRVRRW
jgi:hypothetical protein